MELLSKTGARSYLHGSGLMLRVQGVTAVESERKLVGINEWTGDPECARRKTYSIESEIQKRQ